MSAGPRTRGSRVPRGLQVVGHGDSVRVLDVHCGACTACRDGLDLWCLDQLEDGRELMVLERTLAAEELERWLGALGALAHLSTLSPPPAAVLLVLEDVDPVAVADLVRPWHTGPVIASVGGRDEETRARLAELSPTGRAQVVVALRDARTAVRSVERGGHVCLPHLGVDAPSVTELVQRDVKLVAPRRIEDLVTSTGWDDLAHRFHRLLQPTTTPEQEVPRA